jgi:dTDP-glucose 4,6-dehydratase
LRYQRYAVLGSNSFAGAAFVARALRNGLDVVGINRSPESAAVFLPYRSEARAADYGFHQADINHDLDRIVGVLERFRPQVVVDFAGQGMVAESWNSPAQWYSTNVVAKVRLHDHLRQMTWLERYVRVSTPEVYGSQESRLAETWVFNPSTPYAVSHAAVDMSLRAFHHHYGFPVVFTRFANFYGPGQQLYRIVPRTILSALTGTKLQLHGGGKSVRAFIYGDDVADGLMRAAEAGTPGEIYHFSSDRFLSIREAVGIICQRAGVDFEAVVELAPERPAKDQAYLMDASKAKEQLGWRESVTFEQGVDATIQWAREHLDRLRTLDWSYVHKA